MTATTAGPHPRRLGRSIGAVLLGIVVGAVLSLGTDQVMHSLGVYPGWGKPMHGTGLFLLALAYRTVYGVIGSFVAARFAPYAPMRHALIVGVIGTVLSLAGVIATIGKEEYGPAWYPITLAIITMPTAWLGGALHRRRHATP